MRELRPYQHLAIDRLAQKAAKGIKRIIFQLATGGGKTVSFAGLIHRFLGKQQKRVLILVHREELLKQARRTLYEWYDIVAAPVTAGNGYLPNALVYVAMVETANNRLKKNPKYFGHVGLVIVDECHLGNFRKLYDFFPEALIIGFTATPISSSKKDPLKNHFKDIVCGIDIPDLIASGSLVPNRTIHVESVSRKDLKIKNGEFDEQQMAREYSSSKHVQNCLGQYRKHAQHTKTLIFNCNIEHSKKVNEAFLAFGFEARHLDGETPEHERRATLEWFHRTPNAILNNVGVLTTGFDEPSVQTIIVNKATKSLPLWLQMTGRGSRPFPGKEFFTIIDMGGNAKYEHDDWCASRNWSDWFHNPDKPREGGEAPLKSCKGCAVLIHLSTKICKHCGAENINPPKYDDGIVSYSLLSGKKPFEANLAAMIAENADKKDYYTLHLLKSRLSLHIKQHWRLRRLDDNTAYKILGLYQDQVKAWCKLKNKQYNQWHQETTNTWMKDELKRAFQWSPPTNINA